MRLWNYNKINYRYILLLLLFSNPKAIQVSRLRFLLLLRKAKATNYYYRVCIALRTTVTMWKKWSHEIDPRLLFTADLHFIFIIVSSGCGVAPLIAYSFDWFFHCIIFGTPPKMGNVLGLGPGSMVFMDICNSIQCIHYYTCHASCRHVSVSCCILD